MLYLLNKMTDKGVYYPQIVTLFEAQRVYNEVCEKTNCQPDDLSEVGPCVLTDEDFNDFLWIVDPNESTYNVEATDYASESRFRQQVQKMLMDLGYQWEEHVFNDGNYHNCYLRITKDTSPVVFTNPGYAASLGYTPEILGWGRFTRHYCWTAVESHLRTTPEWEEYEKNNITGDDLRLLAQLQS